MNNKKINASISNLLFKSIAMLIVLISVTFSWFVFTKDSNLESILSGVSKAGSVSISTDGEKWGSKLEFNADSGNITITEYSGNGQKLYMPVIEKKQIVSYFLPGETGIGSDTNYIEATAYIKTDIPIHLYLSQLCSVTPSDSSEKANFIAGAVRVAVWVEGEEPIIWAPNSTFEYKNGTINPEGTPESKYTYVYSESNEQIIDVNNIITIDNSELKAAGVSENKKFVWGNLKDIKDYENSVDPIFSTEKEFEGEIEKQIYIRIWVEGTDREAVQDLLGGKFEINLQFKAVGNN